jgi:hypothetical protein
VLQYVPYSRHYALGMIDKSHRVVGVGILVCAAAVADGDKPVVLVVMGGSASDLSALKTNPSIRAIVWVGYPGQASGTAIAHALLGNFNKFGKLPMTWYDEGFCEAANLTDYRMRPDPTSFYPGRTHR